ncbi:MAG: hypothetical protein HY865_12430 [Chloroflexi bacterium]|nr:hypothetical protein [Chloroflexota bacterium]
MSKDNYSYNMAPTPNEGTRLEIWDMLSILMLILTLCVGAFYVAIFLYPQATFNPLKPNPAALSIIPTPTIAPIQLEPTWTVTPTVEPSSTPTLVPTYTVEPTFTPFSLITPSITPTATATPKAPFSATITYIASTIIHEDLGCNWQGIGGTVVDASNADMLRMTIRLTGRYDGKSKTELTVSSIAPAYGKSGYEFFLGTTPISSKGELYLQLLDQAGVPLSSNIYIDTFSDCSKNLVLVRFKKNP